MVTRTIIRTNNKEIYNKLNMLLYSNQVVLNNTRKEDITKIINNINSKNRNIDVESTKNRIILKKLNRINYSVYHQN